MSNYHFMLDLETLGTRPGSVILSIGIAEFSERGIEHTFYRPVRRSSCIGAGLTEDPRTIQWWSQQSEEARRVVTQTEAEGIDLSLALDHVANFLPPDAIVWGNGAAFDNTLLAEAYARLGREAPWKFYNDRCFRTLKNVFQVNAPQRAGVHHNALDDAVHQAEHAIRILWPEEGRVAA